MTPTQLLHYATVVRTGSVRAAAAELAVTDAAVSGNVAALRRELGDRLYAPSRTGLVFTPGGQRLAQRAGEILGLQDLTRREVASAAGGRRVLRIAATSLFAEYAAPGLIELFSARADDLDVELVVEPSTRFRTLLSSRSVDVVIGPQFDGLSDFDATEFLRYDVVAVGTPAVVAASDSHRWLLGPSAVEPAGVSQFLVERAGVDESRQRIFGSHSAALEEARSGHGIAVVPEFSVADAIAAGTLRCVDRPTHRATGVWTLWAPPGDRSTAVAAELRRFVATPRAIQAMLSGSGSEVRRFKPRVHITLWS